MQLKDRTVLLTGATGGIGHAIAYTLHARGARLIVSGRRADVLEPLAAEVGGRALPADMGDRADLQRLIDACADVDVVIANAGVGATGHGAHLTVEQIDRALEVNLRAPIVLTQALGARMAKRGSGHIVLVSSLNGMTGTPRSSLYNATKFGLRGFGQGMRSDLRPSGVGVSVVFPGFVSDAGMFADTGVKLPRFMGTSSPQQVADGVVKAIEGNRGEVIVAPLSVRMGVLVTNLAPGASAAIQRRLGSEQIADAMVAGQEGWTK